MNALGNKYTHLQSLPLGHRTQPLNPLAKPFTPNLSGHRRELRDISSYDIHFPPLESVAVLRQSKNKGAELPTLPESASTKRDAQSVCDLYIFICKNLHRIPKDIKLYGCTLSAREVMMEERSDLGKLWKKLKAECRMTNSAESYTIYEILKLVESSLNPYVKKKFPI